MNKHQIQISNALEEKEKGLFLKFMVNTQKYNRCCPKTWINKWFKKSYKPNTLGWLINDAFNWAKTPEGFSFWSHLFGEYSSYKIYL